MARRSHPLRRLFVLVLGATVIGLVVARLLREGRPSGSLGAPVIVDRPAAPARDVQPVKKAAAKKAAAKKAAAKKAAPAKKAAAKKAAPAKKKAPAKKAAKKAAPPSTD